MTPYMGSLLLFEVYIYVLINLLMNTPRNPVAVTFLRSAQGVVPYGPQDEP